LFFYHLQASEVNRFCRPKAHGGSRAAEKSMPAGGDATLPGFAAPGGTAWIDG
jgi:hypothetical protein